MQKITKHTAIVLPVMVVLAIGGWIVFSALARTQASLDEVLLQLAWLPVLTGYGVAGLIGAAAAMKLAGLDLAAAERRALVHEAQEGSTHALLVLVLEGVCWLVLFALAAWFMAVPR